MRKELDVQKKEIDELKELKNFVEELEDRETWRTGEIFAATLDFIYVDQQKTQNHKILWVLWDFWWLSNGKLTGCLAA